MHFHLDFTEQLNRLAEAFHKYEIDEVKLEKYCQNIKVSTRRLRAVSCTWPASPATWPSITRTGPSPRPSTQSWGRGKTNVHKLSSWLFIIRILKMRDLTNTNQFQDHRYPWEQLPLWRWQVSSGMDVIPQKCHNISQNVSGHSSSLQSRSKWRVMWSLQEAMQKGQSMMRIKYIDNLQMLFYFQVFG